MDSVAIVKYKDDVGKTLEEGVKLLGGFGVLQSPLIKAQHLCGGG